MRRGVDQTQPPTTAPRGSARSPRAAQIARNMRHTRCGAEAHRRGERAVQLRPRGAKLRCEHRPERLIERPQQCLADMRVGVKRHAVNRVVAPSEREEDGKQIRRARNTLRGSASEHSIGDEVLQRMSAMRHLEPSQCGGRAVCPARDGRRREHPSRRASGCRACRAQRAPRRRRGPDHDAADPPCRDAKTWKQRPSSARRAGRESERSMDGVRCIKPIGPGHTGVGGGNRQQRRARRRATLDMTLIQVPTRPTRHAQPAQPGRTITAPRR